MARGRPIARLTVRSALAAAPSSFYKGAVVRFVFASYRATVSSPAGAFKNGGRYNSPGTNAVYTSLLRPTALAEFTQDFAPTQPVPAAAMLAMLVSLRNVVDVTGGPQSRRSARR